MEFRIISKMCCHKDHVNNFFVSANSFFFKLNRHKNVLPFKHNRVILSRSPKVGEQLDEDDEQINEWMNDPSDDNKLLKTYTSASFINSHIREYGKAFIAA